MAMKRMQDGGKNKYQRASTFIADCPEFREFMAENSDKLYETFVLLCVARGRGKKYEIEKISEN